MAKYFYTVNKNNIQQIDDSNSAYALDRVENLNDYFCGLTDNTDTYTFFPLVLDGSTLCGDTSQKNQRTTFWLCYIIPKYTNELIYVYNPDSNNPAYIIGGRACGDVIYSYGCKYSPSVADGGVENSWALRGYSIRSKIVDVTVPSKAMADVIYVFGGHLLHYRAEMDTSSIINSVAGRKGVADKLKILRFRPIREIASKLNPFGLAVYNAGGELIYTVDNNGKNYQMADFYINNTYIAGTYLTGQTPNIGSYTSRYFDNLAIMPVGFPGVIEGFTLKGHRTDIDPARLYPIKLLRNRWSISQLSGCGVGIPGVVALNHPNSRYQIRTYSDRTVGVSNRTYFYRDELDGYYSMQFSGNLSLLTMDCSRYI